MIGGILKSCRANVGPTRWHYVGIHRACWAKGVEPIATVGNWWDWWELARWAKWHRANVICQRRASRTTNKMPTFAQRMIANWVVVNEIRWSMGIVVLEKKSKMWSLHTDRQTERQTTDDSWALIKLRWAKKGRWLSVIYNSSKRDNLFYKTMCSNFDEGTLTILW